MKELTSYGGYTEERCTGISGTWAEVGLWCGGMCVHIYIWAGSGGAVLSLCWQVEPSASESGDGISDAVIGI